MKYYAKVIALNPDIEEEVTISLGEIVLTCFISELSRPIQLNSVYLVTLELEIFDEISAELSTDSVPKQIESSFAYELNGYLFENKLIVCNTILQHDLLYYIQYYNMIYCMSYHFMKINM
ncbi:MAG: hypothetical protein ACQEWL_05745 [Pseudomonadota bacterium]